MTKTPNAAVVKKMQALYTENSLAARLFDNLAGRTRDARAITIDNIARTLGLNRGEALTLARAVTETGCAELYLGRRGAKTRLLWSFSCISIGQAAAGETAKLEDISDPEPDEGEDSPAALQKPFQAALSTHPLTIAEAKAGLALKFGVSESSIDIVVRA